MKLTSCLICTNLPSEDLAELDILMGDPTRWPKTVWGMFDPPKGALPPGYRRYGGVEMGRLWLTQHNYEFSKFLLRRHYRFDVVHIPADADDLLAIGVIVDSDPNHRLPAQDKLDPMAFMRYYAKGIEIGNRGLDHLAKLITDMEAKDTPIPFHLVKMMVEVGSKLAISQATLRKHGAFMGEDDDLEGFRAGGNPLPSKSINGIRVRTIEGARVPVVDGGPNDRAQFNERARNEGTTELPAPR